MRIGIISWIFVVFKIVVIKIEIIPIKIKKIPTMIDITKKEFNKNLWNPREKPSYFNIINLILKLIKIRVFYLFQYSFINEKYETIRFTVSSV